LALKAWYDFVCDTSSKWQKFMENQQRQSKL